MEVWRLVAVGKSAHAGHHAQHVVVRGVHVDRGRRGRANRVVGDREQQRGVINTRQVARA